MSLAVHRTIVAVDVEGFGDRHRTNRNQLAVRDGLYRAMREAFRRAGIPWAECDHEDRGDGMFILVGPEVPKGLFVESLPSALVDELSRYNSAHPDVERIRLRIALHAGEVNFDEHGATAASINLTFRLLESGVVKEALAGSSGVLAVITSSWFFEEVVRHTATEATAYRPVPVAVKETTTIGWICLPDHMDRPDSGLVATLHSSEAHVAERSARPAQMQLLERTEPRWVDPSVQEPSTASELPVAVPLGRLPTVVRGRDTLLAELRRPLARKRRSSGGTWVLAGMGGLGKSTVALATAATAQARGWQVWWVTATDTASLTGGILEVLRQMGAPESVAGPVREGAPAGPERAWTFLNGTNTARRRWLLVLDNADAPFVLAAHGAASPADHDGWLRPNPAGMMVVTTRTRDPRVWGPGVILRELQPLDDDAAAKVLTDLAPAAEGPMAGQARELGRRLGGLPLALHLAGCCLASPFARWPSFGSYHRALDSAELPAALADLDDPGAQARATIQQTWGLSLDALAADGRSQARPLIFLLSCFAPATLIPATMLRPEPLADLLAAGGPASDTADKSPGNGKERRLRDGLHGLAAVGLINIADTDNSQATARGVTVHPVVADANRSCLLYAARSDMPVISEAAVSLLITATSGLDYRHPPDWPTWRKVVPHVMALLEWLAPYLATDTLSSLLDVSSSAADALSRSGDRAEAERLGWASVTAAARLGADHRASLMTHQTLADKTAGQGRYREAEELYGQVLTRQLQVLGGKHPDTLKTRRRLASSIAHQGRYREAELMYLQVLPDLRQTLGDEHPDTLTTRGLLAWVVRLQGRHSDAEQLYQRVLSERQRILGDDHPETLSARHHIAQRVAFQAQYEEAEHMHHQVLGDRRRVLGDDHPDTVSTLSSLAWVVGLQGRFSDAEQLYRRVLADLQRVLGDDHPDTLTPRHAIAWTIAGQGRLAEAEQLYQQVLADRERVLGDDHPDTSLSRQDLAWVIWLQGRHSDAEQLYQQVLADRQRVLGDDHPDTNITRDLVRLITLKHQMPG